jgi:hypothetical protein
MINPQTSSKMYRVRYPVFSGGESGVGGASIAATGISIIVGEGLV